MAIAVPEGSPIFYFFLAPVRAKVFEFPLRAGRAIAWAMEMERRRARQSKRQQPLLRNRRRRERPAPSGNIENAIKNLR